MNALLNLHNKPLEAISGMLSPWLLPTLARFTFVAVLFMYFWSSATLKLGDSLFSLSFGAYGQIFPVAFDAAGYDVGQLSLFHKIVAYAGTYAEFVLPVLLAIGLFTRLAALGMIGFVIVQSYVDIFGHMADETTIGSWFDRITDSAIMDQRLFWISMLLLLFIKGAGPLSADKILGLK